MKINEEMELKRKNKNLNNMLAIFLILLIITTTLLVANYVGSENKINVMGSKLCEIEEGKELEEVKSLFGQVTITCIDKKTRFVRLM